MKQNIREVCFHDMCEARGKNNGYASKTLNSERLANPQALEEVRTGSAWAQLSPATSDSTTPPTSLCITPRKVVLSQMAEETGCKKKKNLDFSDSSHPHTWASALTKKSPPQKSNIRKG